MSRPKIRVLKNIEVLAAFIRIARSALDISQKEFASIVGLHQMTIARAERANESMSHAVFLMVLHKLKECGITSYEINEVVVGNLEEVKHFEVIIDWETVLEFKQSRGIK